MAGLVPAIYVFFCCVSARNGLDSRDKPGHDDVENGLHMTGKR